MKENTRIGKDFLSSEKLMHGIKLLMAKNYIDNLREEVAKGLHTKAAQGLYPSFAALGYLNVRESRRKTGNCSGPCVGAHDRELVQLV